jgi:hypothetical protein
MTVKESPPKDSNFVTRFNFKNILSFSKEHNIIHAINKEAVLNCIRIGIDEKINNYIEKNNYEGYIVPKNELKYINGKDYFFICRSYEMFERDLDKTFGICPIEQRTIRRIIADLTKKGIIVKQPHTKRNKEKNTYESCLYISFPNLGEEVRPKLFENSFKIKESDSLFIGNKDIISSYGTFPETFKYLREFCQTESEIKKPSLFMMIILWRILFKLSYKKDEQDIFIRVSDLIENDSQLSKFELTRSSIYKYMKIFNESGVLKVYENRG